MKTNPPVLLVFTALLISPVHAADDPTPKTATKDSPFVNSLGMTFVPVKIIGGSTNGKRILFSVWNTRVQDYAEFAKEKGFVPTKPRFDQEPTHPVVMVNWEYAKSFCAWLTDKERARGTIGKADKYRLPLDHEWSCSVGIGALEDAESSPMSKDGILALYPWGTQWPPPNGFANYDSSLKVDRFEFTSPVGSFPANKFGLFDMSGNVTQWCEEYYSYELRPGAHDLRLERGQAWQAPRNWENNSELAKETFKSSSRSFTLETHASYVCGFRCVLEVSSK